MEEYAADSISGEGILDFWNTDTGECDLRTPVCSDEMYTVAQLNDGRIAASSANFEISIIDWIYKHNFVTS
jgi:hypothetical protein